MPTRIKHLRCRVTVRTGGKGKSLQQSAAKPVKPDMAFAMPTPEPSGDTSPAPAQTATQERGQTATPQPQASPTRADPQAVADRVYELMQQEIKNARQRGL